MTEQELTLYIEEKKAYFTHPELMKVFESNVEEILQMTEFAFTERVLTLWMFEFLCFTIHTVKGKELYLRLLSHIGKYCPDLSAKYWQVYDNQENLKERYRH